MKNLEIVCADIGSVASNNFGWFANTAVSGTTPSSLARHVASVLNEERPVALGFECPLFVPLRSDEQTLTKARPGEHNRAWSAGAGCGALATGLVQVTWALQAIKSQLRVPAQFHSSWEAFSSVGSGLFIWEAFVSGPSKRDDHVADAVCAVEAFTATMPYPPKKNAIQPDSPVHSLLGAALLRTGWSVDLALLSAPTLVIRG
ncbi:MAG: hypothetical protein IPI16_05505 [Comamonadaceae bacterium]|jgi:hypothetical protein|nr:hypothetical protein [Comamonadaceae bacterium]